MRFNPFMSHTLFDTFHQLKKQAKQELSPLISYETDLNKAKEQASKLSNNASRVLVMEMQVKHRYEIPQQRIQFIQSLKKAEFYLGAFHKEISVAQPMPPIASKSEVLKLATQNLQKHGIPGSKIPENVVRKIQGGSLGIQHLPPHVQKILESNHQRLSLGAKQTLPKETPKQEANLKVEKPKASSKPIVANQAPRQLPPKVNVRPPVVRPNPVPVAVLQQPNQGREDELNHNEFRAIPVAALPIPPVGPLGHVPQPDARLKVAAANAAEKLNDDLPMECTDPITLEPLTDPIEINRRVYNRDTLLDMIREGQFMDPFTREAIDPATAKPAHYMLQAMSQHLAVMKGDEPLLLATHKETKCIPLKNLLEQWEQLLQMPANAL